MTDVALVELMLRDRDAGLAAVYERYADRLHDYCRSILRDEADAADALQDTFLAASGRIDQLRDPERLRPWLYAIARNRSYRTIQDRQRERPADDFEHVMTADDAVDTGRIEAEEAKALVWEAAAGLEDADRDVLDLHLRHGLSGTELAAVMGTTAPQANQALHRMRERLNRSVGAVLAIRHGRSDCDELRAIVGHDQLSPLLRKRVARHIERCGICDRHRHAGAAIYAAIPIVPAPDFVWAALASTSAGGPASEHAASSIEWNEAGFPSSPTIAPSPVRLLGHELQPPDQTLVDGRSGVARGGRRRAARLQPPTAVAAMAAAVVVLLALGGMLLVRPLSQPETIEAASDAVPLAEIQTDEADDATRSSQTTGTASPTTSPSISQPADESTTAPTSPTTTATTLTTGASTTASTVSKPSLPTVTFIADGQAPTMSLAVDCSSGVRITATLSDNLDPAPSGDLEVVWPPARSRPVPAVPTAPRYEVLLQGNDLTGLDGSVDFVVSGRISDQAGNTSDVSDSVTCIFFQD